MTWEMDWADRIEEEEREREREHAARTHDVATSRELRLATMSRQLRLLLDTLRPKARHAPALRAAFKDACDYGLNSTADLYCDATARLRQLDELTAHGHPATIRELANVCLSIPADAEPSGQGWRVAARRYMRRLATSFDVSLEEVPNSCSGLSAVGMTHALRALSRFRAASSQDVGELVRLITSSSNPWVGGVGLTALASSDGLAWQTPSLVELVPRLLQVVDDFPGPYATWGTQGESIRREQKEHLASEARRAAAVVLTRFDPCLVAQQEPRLASSVAAVTALLALDSGRVRRWTLEMLRDVQPTALLAPLAATLLEHACSCASRELSECEYLVARVADADLERNPQVLPPARALLSPPPTVVARRAAATASATARPIAAARPIAVTRPIAATTTATTRPIAARDLWIAATRAAAEARPPLLRGRQQLGLQVLLRLAGPHLDTLLRDAHASTEGVLGHATHAEGVEDTDEAKDARLDGLLDDVALATRGLGGEDDEQLCELASRFVAAVEAPGGASAQRHEKSAAQGCGGLVAAVAA